MKILNNYKYIILLIVLIILMHKFEIYVMYYKSENLGDKLNYLLNKITNSITFNISKHKLILQKIHQVEIISI